MLRECPMTPYAADPGGGCGVPVVRQWPRARFRRAALASVALGPHGQGMSPAPLATPRASARRLHQSRGVPRSPRGHKNPRGSRLAVWFERARLRFGVARRAWGGASARTTSRWIAIAAPDCALRRPRRLQPTTLPVAAPWMAAPYHPVTRAARRFLLARSLPPLARRPILAPVTTRSPQSAPSRRAGSDRRQPRQPRPRVAPTRPDLRRPCSPPNDTNSACSLPSLSQSVRRARASRTDLTSARQANRRKRRLRP